MDEIKTHKKSRVKKVIGIIGAWLTLPVLGVCMLVLTSVVGQSVGLTNGYQDQNFTASLVLNGMFGLIIIGIIITAVWRVRKRAYFFQLLIGLWIGLGAYAIILAIGLSVFYAQSPSTEASLSACTNRLDKLYQSADAIIPIETDAGYGSAFVIDEKGTMLTAYHVVEGANDIFANFASGRVEVTVLKNAPEYDLALLQLDSTDQSYFALSADVNLGDEVYAYGYPGNAYSAGAPSISAGVVSRVLKVADLRLTDQSAPDGLELIQTDAAINSGNSGGPLIGKCGVVGVVVSVSDSAGLSGYVGAVSEQGIGYAVSIQSAISKFKIQNQ